MKAALKIIILAGITACAAPFVCAASATSTSPGLQELKQSITTGKLYVRELNGVSSTTPGITKTLRRGSSGVQVELLQEFLKRYGTLESSAPTGHFGAKTVQAVTTFQIREQLDPIGVVGPKTRARILEISKHTLVAAFSQATSSAPTIDDARLVTDVGEDGSGIGKLTAFASTTRTIYAVLSLSHAQITSEISYIRYHNGAYVDSAVAHPSRSGLRYMHFQWTLKSGSVRSPGQYTITFYLDGKRSQTINYTIQ